MKAWYLLYCKPRNELRAQQHLTLQQLETYLPMLRVEKREKGQAVIKKLPLFPNYLFVKFDPAVTSVRQLHATRGVLRLVNCSENITPIDDRLVNGLKRKELSAPVTVSLQLSPGDRVRFTSGPFAELEGVFQEPCGDVRCRILFEFLGQMQSVVVNQGTLKASECA